MEFSISIEDIIPILENIEINNIDDIYITVLDAIEDILLRNEINNKNE